MESNTAQPTRQESHSCWYYLFCCCLCGSSQEDEKVRATATTPLLRDPPPNSGSMEGKTVTFDPSQQPHKGILKKGPTEEELRKEREQEIEIARRREEEERKKLEEEAARKTPPPTRHDTRTPPHSPNTSFGSNTGSPYGGGTSGHFDVTQWGYQSGNVSSPLKKTDEEGKK